MFSGIEVSGPEAQGGLLETLEYLKEWIEVPSGRQVLLAGNGGSAAICDHLAVDFCKFLGARAQALTNPAMLSCIGNDYGFEYVFSKQIYWQAQNEDTITFLISSSGASPNILRAAEEVIALGGILITCSAFKPDNPLRSKGDINFYLPTMKYREAEVGHLELLHSMVDV